MIGINYRKATKDTKGTKESRGAGGTWGESGRESTGTGRKPLRGQERLESGWGETSWTTGDNSFKMRHPTGRWMGKGKKKTNRTKGDKNAGGRREEGIYTNFSNAASRTRMAGRRKGCLHENQENRFALFPCGGNVLQSGHRKTNEGNLIEFEPTLTI
jgi:hypothetical protein